MDALTTPLPAGTQSPASVFTIVGGTTIPDRAAVVRLHCREGSRVELRRPAAVPADGRIDVWLQCRPRLGLIPVWKQIGHVPWEVAAGLLPADDVDAKVVAYGTVKSVYAPRGRDEAAVTVDLRPPP